MRHEGERCEHVRVGGRLMRMQRVEFSIRQFPPSPPRSHSLLALARKVSFQRLCCFPGCEFPDGQICRSGSDYSTSIAGARLLSPSLLGGPGFSSMDAGTRVLP